MSALLINTCCLYVTRSHTEMTKILKRLDPSYVNNLICDLSVFPDDEYEYGVEMIESRNHTADIGSTASFLETLSFLDVNPSFFVKNYLNRKKRIECRDPYFMKWCEQFGISDSVIIIGIDKDNRFTFSLSHKYKKEACSIQVLGYIDEEIEFSREPHRF